MFILEFNLGDDQAAIFALEDWRGHGCERQWYTDHGTVAGRERVEVAFFYSDKRGLIALGTLSHATGDQSIANGISDNGRVVGWSGNLSGGEAFTWTSPSGMKRLASVLRTLGAKIPAGTTLTNALSISADGSTIVGQYVRGKNFGNWMAHITK